MRCMHSRTCPSRRMETESGAAAVLDSLYLFINAVFGGKSMIFNVFLSIAWPCYTTTSSHIG
jgi:hypothetical protein